MVGGLVVSGARECEQPSSHTHRWREPELRSTGMRCRDPRAARALVAEERLNPREKAERLGAIAAQCRAGGGFDLSRGAVGLAEQAEVDLRNRLERQRVT